APQLQRRAVVTRVKRQAPVRLRRRGQVEAGKTQGFPRQVRAFEGETRLQIIDPSVREMRPVEVRLYRVTFLGQSVQLRVEAVGRLEPHRHEPLQVVAV